MCLFIPLSNFYYCLKQKRIRMRIQYNQLEMKISGKLDKMFQKENCFIQAQPGNVTLPKKFSEIGEAILDLEVRKDDVWVVSYPRTGKKNEMFKVKVNVTTVPCLLRLTIKNQSSFTTFYLCGKIQSMHNCTCKLHQIQLYCYL